MLTVFQLLLFAALAAAAQLSVTSPRISVYGGGEAALRTEPLSLSHKIATPVKLGTKDVLKIAFTIVDKESGNGVQPHQAFLRFFDARSGEEGIQPLRVSTNGKTKFELDMAKPPISLPPTPDAAVLTVSLILGSSTHDPLQADLFNLILPTSLPGPVHPEEENFHPRPTISHTFRPEQKLPPRPVSAVFAFAVLAPWLALLSLWSQVAPRATHIFSPHIIPFILTLGAFEGLMAWYWIDLKLGQVLLYGSILGLLTVFTGRQALVSIGKRRVGRK